MLSFLKKIFGSKPAEPAPVPYKVETPATPSEFPFPTAKPAKAPVAKKPAAKKPAVKKPTAPKKPKA